MYIVAIVHQGEDEWAKTVVDEVVAAAQEGGLPAARIRAQDDLEEYEAAPAVVVYLASAEAAAEASSSKIGRLAAAGYPVVPLHRGSAINLSTWLPEPIKHLNAMSWQDPRRAALNILRALGLGEEDRKLFLSYRQKDVSALAVQLHTSFLQRGFDVFLDRFSVDVGADFQRQIHIDLADKAFVLFIETMSAKDSRWVEEEVTYAMSHGIPHLAITLPGLPTDRRYETVSDGFRHELSLIDIIDGTDSDPLLTAGALERVIDMVETRYAGLIRRRRDDILGSLTEVLSNAGYLVAPAADWAVIARPPPGQPGETRVFLTTVRAPTARDLFTLHSLREPIIDAAGTTSMAAIVIHPAADVDERAAELVTWIGSGYSVSTQLLQEALAGG